MKYLMWFILVLGIFEIISNIYHLSKGSIDKIGQSAKRQHQELPLDIKNIHFFIKAVIMLLFGIVFLVASILYLLGIDEIAAFGMVTFILFGLYGILQAVVYRKIINVWLSAVVYNIPILLFYIIVFL